MNEFLATYFGTNGASQAAEPTESVEKVAQAELFAKIAEENNINLEAMSDDQVAQLWQATFGESEKTAEFPPKKEEDDKDEGDKEEDDKKEKKAAIEADLQEKKAAQAKFAEADFLGRVMAHSYVQELNKIAEARVGEEKEAMAGQAISGLASDAATAVKGAPKRLKELLTGSKAKMHEQTKTTAQSIASRAKAGGNSGLHAKATKKVEEHANAGAAEGKKVLKARIGTGAAVAGTAGLAASRKKDDGKVASAHTELNELALESALAKVAEQDFDTEEASERLAAVMTLTGGELEATKVASAENADQAIEIRSLELLEAAGYPVTWND